MAYQIRRAAWIAVTVAVALSAPSTFPRERSMGAGGQGGGDDRGGSQEKDRPGGSHDVPLFDPAVAGLAAAALAAGAVYVARRRRRGG